MKIIRPAAAGSLESSDALIQVAPAAVTEIEINSVVGKQFGADILNTVEQVLKQLAVDSAHIIIEDKGALDCVLRARLKAALLRASAQPVNWENII
ncbi:citrate lyase subunit gamma (acyl carrier protein) [Mesocricetibacter intestinalis]|uniref:Citrate lyase acyl carrier protein n=1 Tax=Mesocricetibacter intestinalis TaxID=1521930 RepID=A0A4R6VB55_9PAST|nr:citrate lyase acyl carrier protein [Mesocricetibacter intestinalis]TDQ59407.1 citrate lyase subunit gamma (acyl carrier protein) [Mesocricetibacter intestinalis]